MTINPQAAMIVWLDNFPINELVSESSINITKEYHNGNISVDQALIDLWENCSVELEEWVKFNSEISPIPNKADK